MPRFPKCLFALPLLLASANFAAAQSSMQFPQATETVPELIELWNASDSACRLSRSHDVKIAVACLSRSVYGAALNEREWCLGRGNEANANMDWHECEANSLRFPPFNVPDQ